MLTRTGDTNGSGNTPAGSPGMREVAKRAGVALKTVSRVINREPGVAVDTVERVQAAIDELGYVRRVRRAPLSRIATQGMIGVVVQQFTEPFHARVVTEIMADLHERGFIGLATSSEAQPARELAALEALEAQGVAAIILIASPAGAHYQSAFVTGRTPVVLVDRPIPEVDIDCVMSSNAEGAYDGVRHLIDRGHRRIAIIGADASFPVMRERFAGYRKALLDAGIEPDSNLERLQWLRPHVVARVLTELAALKDPPTAILSASGVYSIELTRELMLAEPIALVCFDDLPMSEATLGGLTVIAQSPEQIANVAVDLVFRRIDRTPLPPQQIRIRTDLIVRGSSLVPPQPLRLRATQD